MSSPPLHPGETRSDSPQHMPTPDEPRATTTTTTFTTNIRPYSASGIPTPPRSSLASNPRPSAGGPSISTRTSFTRVETEDEPRQAPFPARPATASAAPSSSSPFGFGIGMFGAAAGYGYGRYVGRERLTDVEGEDVDGEQGDKSQERASSPSSPNLEQPSMSDVPELASASAEVQPPVMQDPQVYITFLLVTGCRRTMSFEPETTVGRVKELVWNTWPEDEEWRKDRPPAPSFLRLLYLGRLLQDDDTLTRLKIPVSQSTAPQPTIVHLSIRPYAPPSNTAENNDNLNKKIARFRSFRSTNDPDDASVSCCRCIIC